MEAIRKNTTNRSQAGVDRKALETFTAGLRGEVLVPGDKGYDAARQIWNGMIDRRPAVIARCAGAADVLHAVNFARENGLPLSVRGGGHNVAGNAVCDGGLMIDLSAMKSIRVDPQNRTVRVEPGCLLGELDRETQAFGLATPGGIVSTTGVAGLTLGGGFGWLSRKYGLTVDSLISADIVTAAGDLVTASNTQNADLFWGIRGGGGNFGIVTSFEFRVHEVGPEVYCGLILHPFEAAREYMPFHREFVKSAPDELTAWMVVRKAPPLPFLPESVHGQMVLAVALLYLGDPAEGETLVQPIREFATPHGEHLGLNPFVGWQSAFDGLNAPGARNYWKSHNLKDLSDGAIDAILEYGSKLPSPDCEIFIPHMEGAIQRVPAAETAYAHRDAPFIINIHTRWQDPADDETCIRWARDLFDATRPFSTGGVYVNFLSDEGEARVRDAYPPEVWDRLVQLKNKYDPMNLFRLNQNIKPTG